MTSSSRLDPLHLVRMSEVVEESDFRGPMFQLILERAEAEVGIGVVDEEAFEVFVEFGWSHLFIESLNVLLRYLS